MTATPRRRDTTIRRAIAVVAGLNAVAATGGGVSLALGALSLGTEITARLPWASPELGGAALVLWVAVPNAVLCVLALRGSASTALASVVVGVLLVAWILVQLAFIRELSFFHPFYVGVGLLLGWLGARLAAADPGASRP